MSGVRAGSGDAGTDVRLNVKGEHEERYRVVAIADNGSDLVVLNVRSSLPREDGELVEGVEREEFGFGRVSVALSAQYLDVFCQATGPFRAAVELWTHDSNEVQAVVIEDQPVQVAFAQPVTVSVSETRPAKPAPVRATVNPGAFSGDTTLAGTTRSVLVGWAFSLESGGSLIVSGDQLMVQFRGAGNVDFGVFVGTRGRVPVPDGALTCRVFNPGGTAITGVSVMQLPYP